MPNQKPPTARSAMAMAKAKTYQDAADAPATLRAYATDLKNYEAWCARSGLQALPATPEVVGAYLAAAGEGYAMQTLRRRVAAIARASGVAGQAVQKLANSAVRANFGKAGEAPQPLAIIVSDPKAFTAWMMLKARTDRAASAFTFRSPRVRNLPPPDIRLMVPKGCSTVHRLIRMRFGSA